MSSSASHHKRHSILPPLKDTGPKAPVRFSSTATVADSAILTGTHTITLRTESLVHPRAKLDAATGPVDIGKRCIVQERTHVGVASASASASASHPSQPPASPSPIGVTLGDYVTVQACAILEAGGTIVGEGSVVGVGAWVGRGAVIGDYCTICPRAIIPPGAQIPDYTVVFSQNNQRRDKRDVKDIRKRQQVRQLEILQKLIPSNPAKFG
ncbi:unnamed protein product [Discula destructiva]